MIEQPITLLHVLETITPYDYHLIRAGLGHGSGLDSPGFLSLLHIGPPLGQAFNDQVKHAGVTVDDIYRRHEEFFGLHDVAERLLDFDERMQLFRFHHLKLAERIIGGRVVGTMGTPVEVLQQRMEHWLYKDLWDMAKNQWDKLSEKSQDVGFHRVKMQRDYAFIPSGTAAIDIYTSKHGKHNFYVSKQQFNDHGYAVMFHSGCPYRPIFNKV